LEHLAQPDNLIELYLEEACVSPLLEREEETALAELIRAGRTARQALARNGHKPEQVARLKEIIRRGTQARNRLVMANTRLVISVASDYKGLGLPLEDLIQEGNLGLIRAAELFDPEKGYRFSTYAVHHIRQAIRRALDKHSSLIRLPSAVRGELRTLRQAQEHLTQVLGREPTPTELATELGMPPARVQFLLTRQPHPLSLDAPIGNGDDERGELVGDDAPSPFQIASQHSLREAIECLLAILLPRQRKVVKAYFGLDDGEAKTLEEIGETMNVSRQRAGQILQEAMRTLRHPATARKLHAFVER